MRFVVIVKNVGDLVKRPAEHVKSHPEFPLETKEYDSLDEALLAHPGRKIMTLEEYVGFKNAMNLTHGKIQAPKRPWWQFWGEA